MKTVERIMNIAVAIERDVLGYEEPVPGKPVSVPIPTEDQRAAIVSRIKRKLVEERIPTKHAIHELTAENYHDAAEACFQLNDQGWNPR